MKFWEKITRFRAQPALTSLDLTAASLPDWKPPLAPTWQQEYYKASRRRMFLLVFWSFLAAGTAPKALANVVVTVYFFVRTHGLFPPLRIHPFSIVFNIAAATFFIFNIIELAREQINSKVKGR